MPSSSTELPLQRKGEGILHTEDFDDLPQSALTAADLIPGDVVRRTLARRGGIVTRTDVEAEKVWIRQVSNKDRGYVLEERLCRPEWHIKIIDPEPWTTASALGEIVLFVDYAGHLRISRVVDVDDVFLRLRFRIGTGALRELWVDRYVPQDLRRR